jgi:DNA-binding beta-propeller fold protein YncE
VIRAATNTVGGLPIPVGANPIGVAFTPDGTQAYVTNFHDGTVSVINTATKTVQTFPSGSGADAHPSHLYPAIYHGGRGRWKTLHKSIILNLRGHQHGRGVTDPGGG